MSKRYAFIHFPNFCHQQTKIIKKDPLLVLVKEQHKGLYVSELGKKEQALGIFVGMPLANAKAIDPLINHYLHDNFNFKKLFSELADEAMRFSPQVAADNNYGLQMNISGCAHLFGDEQNMLSTIDNFFSQKGFSTNSSIAPNTLLAKALAYFSPNTIIDSITTDQLAHLPIQALFIDRAAINDLNDLGIVNIGELLKLPKKMLVQRFGINILQKLDQIYGAISLPLSYLEEQIKFIFSQHLLSPIRTHDHFISQVYIMLKDALAKLSAHNLSLGSMRLEFKDTLKKTTSLAIESSRAHNHLDHWLELIILKTQQLRFSHGIDDIIITFTKYLPTTHQQTTFPQRNEPHLHDISQTIDRIRSNLGGRSVFHLRATEQHMPEDSFEKDYSLNTKHDDDIRSKIPTRPLRLFKHPIPISVIALLPDNPPAKIFWDKRIINVLHASGPERIEDQWWVEHSRRSRDYFLIEDQEGRRLWIYSTDQPKKWFIHGIFA